MKVIENRIGETKIAKNGMMMTIIGTELVQQKDRNRTLYTIRFEDGFVRERVSYNHFKKGDVKNTKHKWRKHYIGEKVELDGYSFEVIGYGSGNGRYDIRFDNGEEVQDKNFHDVEKGKILPSNIKKQHKNDFHSKKVDNTRNKIVGLTKTNKNGEKATIVDYLGNNIIEIEFEDGYKKTMTFQQWKRSINLIKGIGFQNRLSYYKTLEGTRVKNSQGYTLELVAYRCSTDCDIRIVETGEMFEHTESRKFFSKEKITSRAHIGMNNVGRKFKGSDGNECEVINYKGKSVYEVRFDDGSTKNIALKELKSGRFTKRKAGERAEKKIGKWFYTNCGMKAKLNKKIKNANSKDKAVYEIEFEDGEKFNLIYHPSTQINICHPKLNPMNVEARKNFHNFSVGGHSSVLRLKDCTYYKCTCNKCKIEGMMTPQQMMAHQC